MFEKNKILSKVILVLILISIMSCTDTNNENIEILEGPNEEIVEDPNTNEVINYLALGDSYIIGQGVVEYQRWPNQLRQKTSYAKL